ncbi:MAG: prophage antirepressor [Phycisphaerales bacterium]|nr:prophage antirepressor [Phycisphaerales bacterium]
MTQKRPSSTAVNALLNANLIRRFDRAGGTWYAAVDVLNYLCDAEHAADVWDELKRREPHLGRAAEVVQAPVPSAAAGDANIVGSDEADVTALGDDGVLADSPTEPVEVLDLAGVLRLAQAVNSPRADRLKAWLAAAGAEAVSHAADPAAAAARSRREYEAKGRTRRWVDKRVGGASARQEVTGEWYRRGASASDEFRALTNAVLTGAFGTDTTGLRARKGLTRTSESLRDHMTDLELALTTLGETLAVALHRDRDSRGFDALLHDATDAGQIVARTRDEIERQLGHAMAGVPGRV